jgi:hypothetical protein
MYEAIKDLPKDTKAEIYDAIFGFSLDFVEPELSGLSKTIWILIRPVLEKGNTNFINGNKAKSKPNRSDLEAKPKPNGSEHEAYKDKDKDKDVDKEKDKDIDYSSGKWFKKVDANGFIEAVNKFLTDNPNNNHPRILIEDFINHYTTPNENGGIRVNQFSSFGIQNKLYEMRTDVNRKDRYNIKPTSSIKTI